MRFIDGTREEHPDDQIVVLIPVIRPDKLRYRLLHNQLDIVLTPALRSREDVIVARVSVPLEPETASEPDEKRLTPATPPSAGGPEIRPTREREQPAPKGGLLVERLGTDGSGRGDPDHRLVQDDVPPSNPGRWRRR